MSSSLKEQFVSASPYEIEDICTVILRFIPTSWTRDDFLQYVSQFGAVKSTKLSHNRATNQNRGFGFVTYDDEEAAVSCLATVNGAVIEGRRLKAEYAHADNKKYLNSTCYVSRFGPDLRPDQLVSLFSNYGTVAEVHILKNETGCSRGAGFVRMTTHKEAESAVESLNGVELMGRKLFVKMHNRKKFTLYQERRERDSQSFFKESSVISQVDVYGVPDDMPDEEMWTIFGSVQPANIIRNSFPNPETQEENTVVHLLFPTLFDASQAIENITGKELEGQVLTAYLAQQPTFPMVAQQPIFF
ncbi:putative Polyadenylate-binding protein [Blattamonas nauphoetae]|uniref:Polyadenylate-binding protein n=1 Tax=Blattamonas nauphoetae TaxID=2049346 RepID=A0ABQ9XXK3_9EUKA|nr:putative Polyadenylate-binding protein [Blattamonas nauphoetae]